MELKQELQSGTTLQNGEYTIEKKLGQGGFGITYLAFSKGLQCKLAIKEFFLSSNCMRQTGDVSVHIHSLSLDDFAGFKNRFLSEAQTLAQFDRIPNIVHVKSVFEENNTAYYVMDYLQGETLAQLVKRKGKLSYEEAMNFMGQLCDATEAIHLKGIIHRDINPSNIIITPDNKAVLIDFGTAKEYIQGNTRSTQAIITPGYAPEEQYSTKREKGKYTDIYAIGATMYYCLTGEVPTESIDRRSIAIKEPKTLNASIPNNVNNAILKAMSIEVADRYQRVDDFFKTLTQSTEYKSENIDYKDTNNKNEKNKDFVEKKPYTKKALILFAVILLVAKLLYFIYNYNSNETINYSNNDTVMADSSYIDSTIINDTEEENTVTDYDGNVYETVKIGDQVWMAENLKTKHYRDGSDIPEVIDDNEWTSLTIGAYCNYNEEYYGLLYNWYAVNDYRGLAPDGWHIPSETEWKTLINYLGGEEIAGAKLKSIYYWNSPNTDADNSSGFTALPGGFRYSGGGSENIGSYGDWWSATEASDATACFFEMYCDNSTIYNGYIYKYIGFSVRCIKDY